MSESHCLWNVDQRLIMLTYTPAMPNIMHRILVHFFVLLYLPAISVAATEDNTAAFRTTVKPFLSTHCNKCHSGKEAKANLRVDSLNSDVANGSDVDTWNTIRFKLISEEMPPPEYPRPPRGPTKQVIRWLTKELTAANVTLMEPEGVFLPKRGNLVDHRSLFDGSHKGPAATKARIWRMGPHAYDSLMKGEIGKNVKGLAQPFGGLSDPGLQDFAAAFSIDEPTAAQLMRNARAIVASQTRGELLNGKWQAKGYPQPVKEFVRLFEFTDSANETNEGFEELQRKAIAKQFELILKRQPDAEESSRYVRLMNQSITDAGLISGVQTTLTAVLLTPEAVFRMELGSGEADQHGRRILAPRELAFAIAFALTDRRPDNELLRVAAEGRLQAADDVAREVERIFATEKILKPRIMRFFREYFEYDRAKDVFKDKKLNEHHRADILVRDTEFLINWILDRDQNVLQELLTTTKSFVNYSYDSKRKTTKPAQPKNLVHTSYGLPVDWKWTPHQPIDLPTKERAGILTQPSWLVANSGNFDNHPILRGKWIRERLLGGTIPDLPITVNAQLPEEPEHTLRHRMSVTEEAYCWNCHQRMNPLGLTFEIFDHFGRYRTFESVLDVAATKQNVDKKGKPLGDIFTRATMNATGRIEDSGDSELNGEFPNAVSMLHQLANSDHVRQVFIRHVFRYFLGRNEELSDSPTLIEADNAYRESGGSFRALVTSLLSSDSFIYRVE